MLAICYGWRSTWVPMSTKPSKCRSERAMVGDLLAICCGWHTQWIPMITKYSKYRSERAMVNDLLVICYGCRTIWTPMSTKQIKYRLQRTMWSFGFGVCPCLIRVPFYLQVPVIRGCLRAAWLVNCCQTPPQRHVVSGICRDCVIPRCLPACPPTPHGTLTSLSVY